MNTFEFHTNSIQWMLIYDDDDATEHFQNKD